MLDYAGGGAVHLIGMAVLVYEHVAYASLLEWKPSICWGREGGGGVVLAAAWPLRGESRTSTK